MNKHTIKKSHPQCKSSLKKTWKTSFDEDLEAINHQNKVDRLIAAIQAMSYGETKEDIKNNVQLFNNKWTKDHKRKN